MPKARELEQRLERTDQQLRLLQKISRCMVRDMKLQDALDVVVGLVVEFMECDSCLLYLLDDKELVSARIEPPPPTGGRTRQAGALGRLDGLGCAREAAARHLAGGIPRHPLQILQRPSRRHLRGFSFGSHHLAARRGRRHQRATSRSSSSLGNGNGTPHYRGRANRVFADFVQNRTEGREWEFDVVFGSGPCEVISPRVPDMVLAWTRRSLSYCLPLLASRRPRNAGRFNSSMTRRVPRSISRTSRVPQPAAALLWDPLRIRKGMSKGPRYRLTMVAWNWSLAEVSEQPISLFFLNDSLGWMATDRGVWSTNEGGRTWKKLEGLKKGILESEIPRAHCMDMQSASRRLSTRPSMEARAGKQLPPADQPGTGLLDTIYECISFQGPHGVIVGNTSPPGTDETPAWLNPSEARRHRERIHRGGS